MFGSEAKRPTLVALSARQRYRREGLCRDRRVSLVVGQLTPFFAFAEEESPSYGSVEFAFCLRLPCPLIEPAHSLRARAFCGEPVYRCGFDVASGYGLVNKVSESGLRSAGDRQHLNLNLSGYKDYEFCKRQLDREVESSVQQKVPHVAIERDGYSAVGMLHVLPCHLSDSQGETRNRRSADVVALRKFLKHGPFRPPPPCFLLLLRRELRRSAHVLPARLGSLAAFRRAGADQGRVPRPPARQERQSLAARCWSLCRLTAPPVTEIAPWRPRSA